MLLIPQFPGRAHRALEVPKRLGEGHSRTTGAEKSSGPAEA